MIGLHKLSQDSLVCSGCWNKNITDWLAYINNRNLFLTILEAGRSKIKVPADSVFGEGLLLGSWAVVFLLCL